MHKYITKLKLRKFPNRNQKENKPDAMNLIVNATKYISAEVVGTAVTHSLLKP